MSTWEAISSWLDEAPLWQVMPAVVGPVIVLIALMFGCSLIVDRVRYRRKQRGSG